MRDRNECPSLVEKTLGFARDTFTATVMGWDNEEKRRGDGEALAAVLWF